MTGALAQRPLRTDDLQPSEREFVGALQDLGFGRFADLPIRNGQLVLVPWPKMVQVRKFGSAEPAAVCRPDECELKQPIVEFFEYVRGVDAGEIRCLEVRHGLPFSMEIEPRTSRGVPDVKGEHVEAV